MPTYYHTLPDNRFRLRLDVTTTANVAANTTSWSLTGYLEKTGSSFAYSSNPVYWSISVGGSGWNSGSLPGYDFGQYSLLHLGSASGTTSGSAPTNVQLAYTDSGIIGSGTLSATHTPAVIPLTPTGLTVTRISDASQKLDWTNPGPAYTSVTVQRRANDGSWVGIGSANGNATTYTDTTTAANGKYEYRIAGNASAGQSAFTAASAPIYTSPAAPSSVEAVKVDVSLVRVTPSGLPPYATGYDIEDNSSVIATNVSVPWDHVSPNPAVTHTYRVRGRVGSIIGPWSSPSNTVQLQAPPLAPTGLSPNGVLRDQAETLRLAWSHNPVDASLQSEYQIRHRAAGSSTWIEETATASGDEYADVTPSTFFGSPASYEWAVRTKGADPGWSPWSATATVQLIDRPVAAINSPTDPWNASLVPVVWTYVQAQGVPQAGWEAELRDGSATVLESRSGAGDATGVTFATRAQDGQNYDVRVRVRAGSVWSDWTTQAFSVVFLLPAAPQLSGEWNEGTGSHDLSFYDDVSGEPAEQIILERSIDGGTVWELIGSFATLGVTLSDFEGLSCGTTLYRATSLTVEGAEAETVITLLSDSRAIWLGGGVRFGVTARLPYQPSVKVTRGRVRTTEAYEGRPLPVAYASRRRELSASASGVIFDADTVSATRDALELVVELPEPVHVLRDFYGNRIYGAVSPLALTGLGRRPSCAPDCASGYWSWSLSISGTGAL